MAEMASFMSQSCEPGNLICQPAMGHLESLLVCRTLTARLVQALDSLKRALLLTVVSTAAYFDAEITQFNLKSGYCYS